MNCVFYDKTLAKKIPCTLIPNVLFEDDKSYSRKYFVQVSFDQTKFGEYSVTLAEVYRYSFEVIHIHDIYPINTQDQIDYMNAVVPNIIADGTVLNELDRYEAIINMVTNFEGNLSKADFYRLADLISYELLFLHCSDTDRSFLIYLTTTLLTEQPEVVLVPQIIRMYRTIINKYPPIADVDEYYIDNYNHYSQCFGVLPVLLNIPYFTENCLFIDC